jgi:transcriptional regulator with XRE-family HTH domain
MDHDPLARLRRQARFNRGNKPAIISALSELGVTGRTAAKVAGVSNTTYSFWKNGVIPIPQKHLPALVNLFNDATKIILESKSDDSFRIVANQIRVRRAKDLLDAESKDQP